MSALAMSFKKSANEFKNLRSIIITGLLIAVSMALETFTIEIPYAKVNFAFLAIAVIGMLFGPTVGLAAGFLCDIVGYIARPSGGFLFVYVLIAMLQGLIYGLVLYKKTGVKLLPFAVIARLLDVIIINLFLNTMANMHYGFIPKAALGEAISIRIIKNAVELFADIPLLFLILPAVLFAYTRIFRPKAI